MCLMSKEIRINVRTTEQIKNDLEVTARLRGLTVSSLVNALVVKAIREEKEREPQAFDKKHKNIVSGSEEVPSFEFVRFTEKQDLKKTG